MNQEPDTLTLPPPNLDCSSPCSKWEREYRAFRRLLPQLLQTQHGRYVAVHDEAVVDSDTDAQALILRVLGKVGNVAIHVGLVTEEPEPLYRSGVLRALSAREVS